MSYLSFISIGVKALSCSSDCVHAYNCCHLGVDAGLSREHGFDGIVPKA